MSAHINNNPPKLSESDQRHPTPQWAPTSTPESPQPRDAASMMGLTPYYM